MANDYFQFKQFCVRQERCAMKVGTDGTLLGAWAHGGKRILDIGTGTGLIALMMAQRFADAHVTGIDISEDAVEQARQNAAVSPFAPRIDIRLQDVAHYHGEDAAFDAIVSNPPYFTDALHSPDAQRTMARHTDTLTYRTLMTQSWQLLSDEGELSVVVPTDSKGLMESEAVLAGFFKCREWLVRTSERKPPKRCLLAFAKHPRPLERGEGTMNGAWYKELTKDFYL